MKKSMFFVFACITFMACNTAIEEPLSDDMVLLKSKSLFAENCENVRFQDDFQLSGFFYFDFSEVPDLLDVLKDAGVFNAHPKYGDPMVWVEDEFKVTGFLGAMPNETTIAGVTGEMGSFVTHRYATNEKENSAAFYHLFHYFKSDEGAFVTWDHAVQSPVQNNIARINDKLEVLAGTGVFENATGKFINNGTIDFSTYILHADVHGRICGDGLGKGN
jgi:hypothetical protein